MSILMQMIAAALVKRMSEELGEAPNQETLNDLLKNAIEKDGVAALHTCNYKDTGVCHTVSVGNTEAGQPEVIAFMLGARDGAVIITRIGERVKKGEALTDGMLVNEEGEPPFALKTVSYAAAEQYGEGTIKHYEGTQHVPTFMQVVFSDNDGRLPWDKGFDFEMTAAQPLLFKADAPGATLH